MENFSKIIIKTIVICLSLFFLITPFLTFAAGRGDVCTVDTDCTEGDCTFNRCFCSLPSEVPAGRSECTPKKASAGSACTRGIMCFSNSCVSYFCEASGPGKICNNEGHCAGGDCAGGKCNCAENVCVLKETTPAAGSTGGATATPAVTKISLENPLGGSTGETSVPKIIGNIIKTLLTIVGALALGMFVYGGFTWLTSGGSPEKVKKGKDILMWATIGLIVVFSSYTLVDFLLKAFGI